MFDMYRQVSNISRAKSQHLNTTVLNKTNLYMFDMYRQVSNISRAKSQHLKDSRTAMRLSLPNPLKPDVKSRMKM